ncbi:MAG: ATP-binding protein, partial [Defluviitaleaceae bacterium]|nr:ATP-binding protein [Defluviitaleaceae bacterium]
MLQVIRKHIFKDSNKSTNAPQILLTLCVYTFLTSLYTILFFSTEYFLVRATLGVLMVLSYIALERTTLSATTLAFLSPTAIIGFVVIGALYFNGDFLIFTYTMGAAMISLTYMKPKGLAMYIAATSAMFALFLFGFNMNLLGHPYSVIHNYLSFVTSVTLNVLIYILCKSYAQTLSALTEAKDAANQAALAKGAFLSNISHEIRTPMNAIIGMTAIGKSSNELDRAHYALDKIEDASTHLLGIINDVLDMSKIESGKFELSFEEFDFVKMVQRAINVVSLQLHDKNQQFAIDIDENIHEKYIGDDQRLAQIITNLLSNAVKFTPSGGRVCLTARLLKCENDICTIQIEIADTGIGISPEQRPLLFQAFHQAESSTVRKFGGTGLGLSISKNILDVMGGRIWFESDIGKGTTFFVMIHIERVSLPSAEESNEPAEYTPISFGGRNILIAEDIDINREIVEVLLEPTNIAITFAENGIEAVRIFSEAPDHYELIFMDVQMPEMD